MWTNSGDKRGQKERKKMNKREHKLDEFLFQICSPSPIFSFYSLTRWLPCKVGLMGSEGGYSPGAIVSLLFSTLKNIE